MTPRNLRQMWRDGREVALFDAREEGPFAEGHPFWAVPLPLSRIEERIMSLVPRLNAPVVFYDAGEGLAAKAVGRACELGYTDVSVLPGGLAAYALEGEIFRDVNVPSKAFGELVESIRHTPSLSASELKMLIDRRADMVILDARRFEEYRTMSIPGAISVPGGELALRVRDLAPSPETLVVVNCAGRTRSIIGTQTLVNAGIPNPVAALRNGTIGWTLEGYSLEHGQTRRFRSTAATRPVPERGPALPSDRTVYRFDVRTPEEYAAGHPEGFLSAPGGQLVQALDEWVAVRGALIVLYDDDGVRARTTGSWLRQMGWETVLYDGQPGLPSPARPPAPEVPTADPGPDAVVVDLAPSPVYRKGHIPGAWFMIRSRFSQDLPKLPTTGPLVLTSPDGNLARFVAAELDRPVTVVEGGTAGWIARGGTLELTDHRWASPEIDVYKRPYEGTDNAPEAMRAYIEWELQLVAQLANDGVSNFRVAR